MTKQNITCKDSLLAHPIDGDVLHCRDLPKLQRSFLLWQHHRGDHCSLQPWGLKACTHVSAQHVKCKRKTFQKTSRFRPRCIQLSQLHNVSVRLFFLHRKNTRLIIKGFLHRAKAINEEALDRKVETDFLDRESRTTCSTEKS